MKSRSYPFFITKWSIVLTRAQVRQLSRLLADYQGHLESAIEAELLPGEIEPACDTARVFVADMRADWRMAEDFQIQFGNPTGSQSSRRLCAPEKP
jgi:hypothetical protein